jgi:hypothetical protein
MADLGILVALVGLVGAAGIALGMLAARRLGTWDEQRAAAGDAAPSARGSGSAGDVNPLEDGGETVD